MEEIKDLKSNKRKMDDNVHFASEETKDMQMETTDERKEKEDKMNAAKAERDRILEWVQEVMNKEEMPDIVCMRPPLYAYTLLHKYPGVQELFKDESLTTRQLAKDEYKGVARAWYDDVWKLVMADRPFMEEPAGFKDWIPFQEIKPAMPKITQVMAESPRRYTCKSPIEPDWTQGTDVEFEAAMDKYREKCLVYRVDMLACKAEDARIEQVNKTATKEYNAKRKKLMKEQMDLALKRNGAPDEFFKYEDYVLLEKIKREVQAVINDPNPFSGQDVRTRRVLWQLTDKGMAEYKLYATQYAKLKKWAEADAKGISISGRSFTFDHMVDGSCNFNSWHRNSNGKLICQNNTAKTWNIQRRHNWEEMVTHVRVDLDKNRILLSPEPNASWEISNYAERQPIIIHLNPC